MHAQGEGTADARVAFHEIIVLHIGRSNYSQGYQRRGWGDGASERELPQIPAVGSPLQNGRVVEVNGRHAHAAVYREALEPSLRPAAAARRREVKHWILGVQLRRRLELELRVDLHSETSGSMHIPHDHQAHVHKQLESTQLGCQGTYDQQLLRRWGEGGAW